MQNKPAIDYKYLGLNFALLFGCNLASFFVEYFVQARRVEIAQLFNVSTNVVFWVSHIVSFSLLYGSCTYVSVRVTRYFNELSALSKEETEKQERRKRELAEENAKARAWVYSSD